MTKTSKLKLENNLLKKQLSALGDTRLLKRLQKSLDSIRHGKPIQREKAGL